MGTFSNSISSGATLPARVSGVAETAFGTATIAAFGAFGAFAEWAGKSDGWILFFLALKPLIDLTWKWSFFQFSEQRVNTQAAVGLIVLGLNAIAIVKRAAARKLPRRVMIFLACASLSVVFSPSSWGFNELMRLLAGTTFFYTAGPYLAEPKQFDRFAKLFLLAMVVPVILSFCQWAGIVPYEYWDWLDGREVGRASGTYPTPLSMSFFLYYAFPIGLAVVSGKGQGLWTKIAAAGFLLLASGALALGNHRTAYIIVAVQILAWLVMTSGRKAIFAFLGLLGICVMLASSWLTLLYAPMGRAFSGEDDLENGNLFRGRGFQWVLFLDSYASSGPFHWLWGNGGSVIAGYDPEDTDVDSVEPHNDYIRILHAYGIVGLLLYLSTLWLMLRRSLQLLHSSNEFHRLLARIMALALIAIAIQSMMMEPMRYPTGVWYLFAIGSALFCVKSAASEKESAPA
jgi:O-antigen ligase